MAEEDDPFGAFGDADSESDSDQPEDENAKRIAVSLVQQANAKEKKPATISGLEANPLQELSPPADSEGAAVVPDNKSPTIDLDSLQAYDQPWDPPLYLSPIVKLVSNLPFGGGRGYVALTDLEPGTLVLVERPLMEWSQEQLGKELSLWSVQKLLFHPNAVKIVHDMEEFHPTKKVVDASNNEQSSENPEQVETMMTVLREKHDKDLFLDDMVQLSANRNIQNRDGTPLTRDDILRLFLALRYNGLESGVYTHVAMLNHKCHPNCVKFLPTTTENDNDNNASSQEYYSEVRTTKWVSAGESLTISYMPKLVSHASRRRHLWEQHRFDIGGAELINSELLGRMEFVNGNLPPSSTAFVDDDSVTSRIERAIAEMDLLYQSTKDSLSESERTVSNESWEQAKALEITSLELYEEARNQLQNDNHLLLIPCLVLHLDTCDLVLRQDAKIMGSLTTAQRCKLLGRQVSTARKLVDLQKAYWGQDHFDLARTYLDLAHAIEELLSKSQKHLLDLETAKSSNLTSFRDWSTLEFQYRKEYNRIKDLYPRDAATHVAKKQ